MASTSRILTDSSSKECGTGGYARRRKDAFLLNVTAILITYVIAQRVMNCSGQRIFLIYMGLLVAKWISIRERDAIRGLAV
jgi:hypothetical protein